MHSILLFVKHVPLALHLIQTGASLSSRYRSCFLKNAIEAKTDYQVSLEQCGTLSSQLSLLFTGFETPFLHFGFNYSLKALMGEQDWSLSGTSWLFPFSETLESPGAAC